AFTTEPHASFWTARGWSEEATYRPNTLIVNPLDGLVFDEGLEIGFIGSAYAGGDPVVAVDVHVDGGPWQPATLDYDPGPDVWVLWSWVWQTVAGDHTIQVRCTTASGAQSVEDPLGTEPLDGYDGSMQIRVGVR
ncbi:MAG: hypothetical protein AAF602_24590, partial [Myxococcota bacterium]